MANLLRGDVLGLLCLVVAGLAYAACRRSSVGRVLRSVPSWVSVQSGVLVLKFGGARLLNGVYVDQRYVIAGEAIEAAWNDAKGGAVHIRACALVSEAWRASEMLSSKHMEYAEVTFVTEDAGLAAISNALSMLGLSMNVGSS